MKVLIAFGLGFAAGVSVARRMVKDDPNIVVGPRTTSKSGLAAMTDGILGQATERSLGAIRKARGAIQERLSASDGSTAAWN
jgi:hypothetical protein